MIAGAGAGLLGAAALGAGGLAYQQFQSCSDLDCGTPLYRANHGGVVGGTALLGVAAVLGVTGVVTWRF